MDMKIDGDRVRRERQQRAWTQEHLAGASGVSLRTIQRIETTGAASYESLNALAAVFSLSVADLRVTVTVLDIPPSAPARWFPARRILTMMGALVVASVIMPPSILLQIPAALVLWAGVELALRTWRRSHRSEPPQ